jgi:hypothetical protein
MKNKLISALYFFFTSVFCFGVYEFLSDSKNVIIPLYICLGIGLLAAKGVEYKRKIPVK